jgi:hypothetical protein
VVEVERLGAVLEWCVLHATDDEGEAAFGDHGIPLAGDGAPWVRELGRTARVWSGSGRS